MTTHQHGDTPGAGPKRYWALFAALAAMTVGEWTLYAERAALGLGRDGLVPWLLALSVVKFGLVVAWLMRLRGSDLGWPKKALLVVLVVGGGLVLAPRLLMMS